MCKWIRYLSLVFLDTYWKLICWKNWHPRTVGISTQPKIDIGTQLHHAKNGSDAGEKQSDFFFNKKRDSVFLKYALIFCRMAKCLEI